VSDHFKPMNVAKHEQIVCSLNRIGRRRQKNRAARWSRRKNRMYA